MRERMRGVRERLAAADGDIPGLNLSALADQNGLFAILPLSSDQIAKLREDHGIYMAGSGRINVAGLHRGNIDDFIAALEKVAGAVIPNVVEIGEIGLGGVANPRTDTAFDAMQYRTHEFTFNLIPRDKQEADNIDAILNILHYYSLPSYGYNTSLWNFMIGYPYEFVITMFNQTHINKIERSVLTGLSVDHTGGDRIAFATDYYPAATTMTLSFKEVRLLGRDSEVIFRGGGVGRHAPGIGYDPRLGVADEKLEMPELSTLLPGGDDNN